MYQNNPAAQEMFYAVFLVSLLSAENRYSLFWAHGLELIKLNLLTLGVLNGPTYRLSCALFRLLQSLF
jgi:hypothetical protein